MRESKANNLAGVRRVREDFLVPCHRRVEAKLAGRNPGSATARTDENASISQGEGGGRTISLHIGHGAVSCLAPYGVESRRRRPPDKRPGH